MTYTIEDTDIPDCGNWHERKPHCVTFVISLEVVVPICIVQQLVSLTRRVFTIRKSEFETSSRNHTITVTMKDT